MAIELCSENSAVGMSPRISFSHDLSQTDISSPAEHHHFLRSISSSSPEFDFCIRHSFGQESSSADELFSDGKMLPSEIRKQSTLATPKKEESLTPPPPTRHSNIPPPPHRSKVESSEPEEKQTPKSFWRFKRSSSCGSGYGRGLCPLPLLSRSNSTGSAGSAGSGKRSSLSKEGINQKHFSQKSPLIKQSQKPPLKKNIYGSHSYHGNGVRVNPVLNVPTPNLFGLSSIFSSGNKDKSKRK